MVPTRSAEMEHPTIGFDLMGQNYLKIGFPESHDPKKPHLRRAGCGKGFASLWMKIR
jgi:hypothetical protein